MDSQQRSGTTPLGDEIGPERELGLGPLSSSIAIPERWLTRAHGLCSHFLPERFLTTWVRGLTTCQATPECDQSPPRSRSGLPLCPCCWAGRGPAREVPAFP